jgi:menaquinone-dependent protoporphyrinogen IX oxidase
MAQPNAHSGSDDQRGRVLIVYASAQDHAGVIANAIAARIRSHGIRVEVGDASCGTMPPPQDYDAVVLGSPVGFGPKTQLIARYVGHYRYALAEVPAALFTVSTSGTVRDCDPGGFLAELVRATGWQPDFAAAFAGGEPLPREGWIGRLIGYERTAQQIEALCTDWIGVDQFADKIATELARAAVNAERTEPHASGSTRRQEAPCSRSR